MDYQNTNLSTLQEDCLAAFGEGKGAAIYGAASKRLGSMLETADFRGNINIRKHIEENMYPTIAYYLTLIESGCGKDEAYALTLAATQKAAARQRKKNEAFGRFPFAYPLYRLMIKGVMGKLYPPEGWETQWVRVDKDEIHMNFRRCIYLDLTRRLGCPEMCTVFCRNDDVTLAGYAPRILFSRTGTLAEGADCCDFHFARG